MRTSYLWRSYANTFTFFTMSLCFFAFVATSSSAVGQIPKPVDPVIGVDDECEKACKKAYDNAVQACKDRNQVELQKCQDAYDAAVAAAKRAKDSAIGLCKVAFAADTLECTTTVTAEIAAAKAIQVAANKLNDKRRDTKISNCWKKIHPARVAACVLAAHTAHAAAKAIIDGVYRTAVAAAVAKGAACEVKAKQAYDACVKKAEDAYKDAVKDAQTALDACKAKAAANLKACLDAAKAAYDACIAACGKKDPVDPVDPLDPILLY